MSNIFQIKRGNGAPSDGVLKVGELGIDLSTDTLYVGKIVNSNLTHVIPLTKVSPSNIIWGSQTANYVLAAPNGSNGTPTFRALVAADIPNLGVAQGGTGATQFTVNSLIMSGNSTTAALTTRAITNNTSNTAIATGTNIPTMNTIYYGLVTVNNTSQTRATAIYAPTTAGTANQILVSAGGTSAPTWKATASGAAYATSANGALTFGTLPVAQGGTGLTSLETFVRTTGAQTIGGQKTFTIYPYVRGATAGNFPCIRFSGAVNTDEIGRWGIQTDGNYGYQTHLFGRVYSYDSTTYASLATNITYLLPAVSPDLAKSVSYNILTSNVVPTIQASARYGGIMIKPTTYTGTQTNYAVAGIFADFGSESTISNSRFYFRQWSPNTTANTTTTNYYEQYLLPNTTAGRAANASFDILTSKTVKYGTCTANGNASTTVSYGTTFSSAPIVIATHSTTGANTSGDIGLIKIHNKTTTNFQIVLGGVSTSTARNIDWIAIGTV